MVTVLVVDANKVYAKMVARLLGKELRDSDIDIAINIWELRRRIREGNYSLILADLSVMLDGDEMAEELKKVPNSSTVILWSEMDKALPDSIRKPANRAGLTIMLPNILSVATAPYYSTRCQELVPKSN